MAAQVEANCPRRIVGQLLQLSSDADNQAFIVREEGCLAGLVAYLSFTVDVEVVTMAARAVWFLASSPSHREALREFPGLVDKLTSLRDHSNDKLRRVVNEALEYLVPAPAAVAAASFGCMGLPAGLAGYTAATPVKGASSASAPVDAASSAANEHTAPSEAASFPSEPSGMSTPLAGAGGVGGARPLAAGPVGMTPMMRAFGGFGGAATSMSTPVRAVPPRAIRIQIEGIGEPYWKQQVQRCLITVPGVVSVTLDQRKELAIVYARDSAEGGTAGDGKADAMLDSLLRALTRMGMEGTPLDAPVTAAAAAATTAAVPQTSAPEYLDDEEEEDDSYWGKGVMVQSEEAASLEARLAAKRREESETAGKRETVKRVFSAIGYGLGLW